MGLAFDASFVTKHGRLVGAQNNITEYIDGVNAVYVEQLGVFLDVRTKVPLAAGEGPAWNTCGREQLRF